MPSTTTYRRGQVVVVNVPSAAQTDSEPRPALVVSAQGFHKDLPDVIVCPVSSQPRYFQRPGPGDVPLVQWKAVGLRYPSTVRISNLLAVEKKLIKRVLGKVSAQDLARVYEGLGKVLGLSKTKPS